VGQWLFGWGGYENRLLDSVGLRTYQLYVSSVDLRRPTLARTRRFRRFAQLYGGAGITEHDVNHFLLRRFVFCVLLCTRLAASLPARPHPRAALPTRHVAPSTLQV
jgi:hypothetical protein